ncbi:MAG: SBBP repeat-containing protein, partial [Deltaproteobacteria bacterium]|nr:SBBP repeat-containing protein [Deltaproteobacteria bacterium]
MSLFTLSSLSAQAQSVSWNTFNGGSGQHLGYALTVDASGNVYTAGLHNTAWNTTMFGNPIGSVGFQGGASDGVVAKLNSSGSVVWYRFFGSSINDSFSGVEVDADGNVYVIGAAFGAFTNLSDSPIHAYVGGDIDIFVAKLDSNGALLWDTYIGSTSNDYPIGIDLDSSGNIYIGGQSYHGWHADFNNVKGTDKTSDGYQGYIVKLNNSGTYQWHRFLTTYAVYDVAAGNDGYLYTVKKGLAYVNNAWNYPAEVGKYDVSTGAQSWTNQYGSGTHDGFGIDLDSSGNIYVKGVSSQSWGSSPVRAYTSGNDAYVFKLNNSGTLQWNTFLGGSGNDNCRSSNACTISVDSSSNIYVSGFSTATWGSPSTAFAGGTSDGFVAALDSTGALSW